MLDLAAAPAAECCGDGRQIVVAAIAGNRVKLNAEPDVPVDEGVSRLRDVLSTHAEKVVWIKGSPGITWGEFMNLVDDVWPDTEILSLLTPPVEALVIERRSCLDTSCAVGGSVADRRDCAKLAEFHH
ncbi:MAG: hypothetical protein ABSH56_21720 [Bryobacteraceae bacterium]|jgi:hypothetical protein